MGIKLGDKDLIARYIGTTEIIKSYLGNQLVWEKNVAPEEITYTAEPGDSNAYTASDGSKYYDGTTTAGTNSANEYATYWGQQPAYCAKAGDQWICASIELAIGDEVDGRIITKNVQEYGGTDNGGTDNGDTDTGGTDNGGTDNGGGTGTPGTVEVIPGSANRTSNTVSMYAKEGVRNGANADGDDGHAAYNSAHHSNIYTWKRSDGQWRQSWTYYGQNKRMMVSERNFPDGNFDKHEDVHYITQVGWNNDPNWNNAWNNIGPDGVPEMEVDNHNNITMTVSDSGRTAVMGNHHSHRIKLAITDAGEDINGNWTNYDFNDFPGDSGLSEVHVKRVTYPQLFNYKGEIWMQTRGQQGNGSQKTQYWWNALYRFNESNDSWVHMKTIQYGGGLNDQKDGGVRSYPSNVTCTILADGTERMSLFTMWRDDKARVVDNDSSKNGNWYHHDLMHYYTDDGVNWRQHKLGNGGSQSVSPPYTFYSSTGRGDAPVKIWDTTGRNDVRGDNRRNGGYDGFGNARGVVKQTAGSSDYHYIEHGPNGWTDTVEPGAFGNNPDGPRFVTLPDGKTGLVWKKGTNIHFMKMDPSAGSNYSNGRTLISGQVNGDYNAILDEGAERHGWLSMAIFKAGTGKNGEAGRIYSIPIAELETWNEPNNW